MQQLADQHNGDKRRLRGASLARRFQSSAAMSPPQGSRRGASTSASGAFDGEALFSQIVDKAKDMLQANRPSQRLEESNIALALLATRITTLDLGSADARRLVSEHMATAVGTLPTPGGGIIYARYISEPMVAIAAFVEMHRGKRAESLLKSLLSLLRSRGTGAIITVGSAGNVVASAMLLFAYDYVLKTTCGAPASTMHIGAPAAVGHFLSALFGNSALKSSSQARHETMLNSFICPLQMIAATGAMCRERLHAAFRRRCALLCDRDEQVFDAILPMALASEQDRNMESLTPNDISGIFVKAVHWREDALSAARIDEIFASMGGTADALVPNAGYILLIVAVGGCAPSNERWNGGIAHRYDGRRLQMLLPEVSAKRSPFLTENMATSLCGIARHGEVEPTVA